MRYFNERDKNGVTANTPHYSLQEVAEELECSIQTVRRRLKGQMVATTFFSGKLWLGQNGLDLLRSQSPVALDRVGAVGIKPDIERYL